MVFTQLFWWEVTWAIITLRLEVLHHPQFFLRKITLVFKCCSIPETWTLSCLCVWKQDFFLIWNLSKFQARCSLIEYLFIVEIDRGTKWLNGCIFCHERFWPSSIWLTLSIERIRKLFSLTWHLKTWSQLKIWEITLC